MVLFLLKSGGNRHVSPEEFLLINILSCQYQTAFGQLSDVATDSGTYRGYISQLMGG